LARAAARERQAAHERAQQDEQQDELDYDELEQALQASVEQLRIEALRDEATAAATAAATAVIIKPDTECVAESETRVFHECVVCMAKPPSHVLIPCGHLCMCLHCSVALQQCPICRVRVQSTMRVYF
jgi:hypothetical protein